MSLISRLKKKLVRPEVEEAINNTPKSLGSFGFDPWGFNPDDAKFFSSIFKPVYDMYYRVETFGLENIPKDGRLLVIPNHSGQQPMDGGLVAYAMLQNKLAPRLPRAMAERWFPTMPYLGNFINRTGAVIGDPDNCAKMLQNEEAIMVYPEGARGILKPFSKRYQLQRFGLGFMHLAMEQKTPIIPVGIVGCEESILSLGSFEPLAKAFSLPGFPIAIPIPLPTKVIIGFGEPILFDSEVQSEAQVQENVDRVKDVIDDLIAQGLKKRKNWFY